MASRPHPEPQFDGHGAIRGFPAARTMRPPVWPVHETVTRPSRGEIAPATRATDTPMRSAAHFKRIRKRAAFRSVGWGAGD